MNLTTAVILIVGTVLLVGYGLSRQIRQGLAAGMDLHRADLSGAKANEDTLWPEGFDPVAAGVIFD
jgi:hypothetical protein